MAAGRFFIKCLCSNSNSVHVHLQHCNESNGVCTIVSSFGFIKAWFVCFATGSMGQRQDSLKQLTELVHKGEKKGLFSNKMPARIQQVIREENLLFMRNRNVYDADYFTFVRVLCSKNMVRS